MKFWIFMLIMDLLLPFTMIGFGRYFMKKAPKEINSVFGYRTSMSMKNKDTYLNEKDSEFLINNNYTKEEVLSGFKQLLVQSGYNNLLYMIKDDE